MLGCWLLPPKADGRLGWSMPLPFLERYLPELLAIIKVHSLRFERACIVRPADPIEHGLVLFILRVSENAQKSRLCRMA